MGHLGGTYVSVEEEKNAIFRRNDKIRNQTHIYNIQSDKNFHTMILQLKDGNKLVPIRYDGKIVVIYEVRATNPKIEEQENLSINRKKKGKL